jgi:glycosyltransferase involved in cell wall biosynthesis
MIAPAAVEYREAATQMERWPSWQKGLDLSLFGRLEEYERRTWSAVDHILAPSEYVKDGLRDQDVPDDKVTVVPYAVDDSAFRFVDRRGRGSPPTIGFIGNINLRKGAPYYLEVARRLSRSGARFVMVGRVELDRDTLAAQKGQVEIVGAVPRSHVPAWLERIDIMFFPTTCEGSAYALMEAMATGVPVVTSPNSGTVARNEAEGFIVPYDDVNAAAEHLSRLIHDRELRWEMGAAARQRYEAFNLDAYSRRLTALINRLMSDAPEPARP